MNKDRVKQLLLRDKQFLKSLYDSQHVSRIKNILGFASDSKLNTLLKVIHLLSNGEIKVHYKEFSSILFK